MNKTITTQSTILSIEDLVVEYPTDEGNVRAVDHVSLDLNKGEVLGLVGESGCGKSTLGFSLLKLLRGGRIQSGKILFKDQDIAAFSQKEMKEIRGQEIAMIFQASQNVLNPLQKVNNHFHDTLAAHKLDDDENWQRVMDLINRVEIPVSRINDHPFQFSGGMQQRIVIALSLILNPEILIADEPTTALDVLVQARIIELLKELKDEFDLTMIFISHDLSVVAEITHRVAIMYAGQIVELGTSETIFTKPKHPYTEALIDAIPNVKEEERKVQKFIPGSPPDLRNPPPGCRFANRCNYALSLCSEHDPELIPLTVAGKDHQVRCFKYDDRFKEEFN